MKLKNLALLALVPALTITCTSSRQKSVQRKVASEGPQIKYVGFVPRLVVRDPKDIPSSMREVERTQKAKTCLRAICGNESGNFTYSDAVTSQEKRYVYREGTPFYKKVDDLLREQMVTELRDKKFEYDLVDWLAQSGDFTLPPAVNRLFGILEIVKIWAKGIAEVAKSHPKYTSEQYYAYKFSPDDFKELNLEPELEALFFYAQKSGFISRFTSLFGSTEPSLRLELAKSYPKMAFPEALKAYLTKCAKEKMKLYTAFGLEEAAIGDNYCAHLLKFPEEPIDEARLKDEAGSSGFFDFLSDSTTVKFLEKYNSRLSERLNALMVSEKFTTKRQIELELAAKDPKDVPEFSSTLEDCHKSIGKAREVAGSPLMHRSWRKFIHEIKRKTVHLVHFQNRGAQAIFERRVYNSEFTFPPEVSVLEKYILNRLTDEAKDANFAQKQATTNSVFKQNLAFFALFVFLQAESSTDSDEEKLFSDTAEICKAYASETLSDHMYSAKGASFLSWVTLNRPQYGVGIAAHEMGHYVSHILSDMGQLAKGSYYKGLSEHIPVWETRRCVNMMHTQTETPGKENQWAEEDWADAFGGRLVKEMMKDNAGLGNFGCLLTSDYGGEYADEFNQSPGDTHSNSFLRTVHIETLLYGKVPPACAELREVSQICR